jgi:hypothetical protein
MPLTAPQLATLKTAIIADPVAGPLRLAGDTFSLLAWCNGPKPSTPAWRTQVLPQESDEAATYTTFDALAAGKRDSWRLFLGFARDYSKAKVRNWIVDVWGAATAASISEAILTAGVENATNAQAVLGGTSPATGTVTALKRNFDGQVMPEEVNKLVN